MQKSAEAARWAKLPECRPEGKPREPAGLALSHNSGHASRPLGVQLIVRSNFADQAGIPVGKHAFMRRIQRGRCPRAMTVPAEKIFATRFDADRSLQP